MQRKDKVVCAMLLLLAIPGNALARELRAGPGIAKERGKMKITTELSVSDAKPSEWKGPFCNETSPSARKISSRLEWEKLWKTSFKQEPPPADFSKHFAAAVFLGIHNTGGYSVEFLDPLSDGTEVRIRYRVRKPKTGAFVIQAFTQPYAIKLYRKTALKVSFMEES